jgi:putative hydrolase of the HAD superfamily
MNTGDPRKKPHRERVTAWVFDLDNTLYPAGSNLFAQVDERIGRFIAERFGLDREAARAMQKRMFRQYGTSLRGLMTEYGMDPGPYLDFVHDIDVGVVRPSPALDAALTKLAGRKYVFTNGSSAHAERIMARLGVRRHIDAVFDVAAAGYNPKPFPIAYDSMVKTLAIEPTTAVFADDIERNLGPAARIGMTTLWVADATRPPADYVHHVAPDLAAWLAEIAEGD